jgi:hypothetical protein
MTIKKVTRKRIYKRKMIKMKGGAFSEQEQQVLVNNGFTQQQISQLQELNVDFETIIERIDQIMNQSDMGFSGNSDGLTQQVLNSFQNGNMNMGLDLEEAIPQNPEDIHDLDITLDDNMFDDGGPMHLDDLQQNSLNSTSGYTSNEESDFLGGRTNKMSNKKTNKKTSKKTSKKSNKKSNKKKSNKKFKQ